jgi:hypothetical protein
MKKKFIIKFLAMLSVLIFSVYAQGNRISDICNDEPKSECLIVEAERLANEINDSEKRKINQAIIATAWSVIGLNDKAINLIKDIGDVSEIDSAFARASILGDMSLVYAKNGDQKKSESFGKKASSETINIHNHFERAVVLFGIAYNQIESGNLKQARLITDSLTSMVRFIAQPEAQLLLVASTAWLHAKLKNKTAANSVLNSIESGLDTMMTNLPKVATYSYFGVASGLVGNKEKSNSAIAEAKQITRKIDNPAEQLTALTILLDAQNDLQNIATRKQTLHHIFEIIDLTEDRENKIWALTVAAIASSGSE